MDDFILSIIKPLILEEAKTTDHIFCQCATTQELLATCVQELLGECLPEGVCFNAVFAKHYLKMRLLTDFIAGYEGPHRIAASVEVFREFSAQQYNHALEEFAERVLEEPSNG